MGRTVIHSKLIYVKSENEANMSHKEKGIGAFKQHGDGESKDPLVGPLKALDLRKQGDFYCCIRPLLQLGRFLGTVPISGLWNSESRLESLGFTSLSIWAVASLLIIITLLANVGISTVRFFRELSKSKGGALEVITLSKPFIYYLAIFLMYMFFFAKSRKLIVLFSTWRKVERDLAVKVSDSKLSLHINILTTVIYISSVIGVVLEHLVKMRMLSMEENTTKIEVLLKLYYKRFHSMWEYYIPYHSVFILLLIIFNALSVLASNYADLVIIAASRALYFKFKSLVHETEKKLVVCSDDPSLYKLQGTTWTDVRRDHLLLCRLVEEFQAYLSPLVFLSYSVNICFICLQLQQGLTSTSDKTPLETISAVLSFLHILIRTLIVSVAASKINDYAHKIVDIIHKCSSTTYCKEVERLERMLGTIVIGLSGLGCFFVTRNFILVLVSLVFTMEIVFMQISATKLPAKPS